MLRIIRLCVHVADGLATTALAFPFAGQATRTRLKRRWARRLLAVLGIELHTEGVAPAAGALLVANHVSWLDVVALAAHTPTAFVAKAEVRRWPVIGWLAARAGTQFLERRLGRHLLAFKDRLARMLDMDERVAVFPEGTSGDGSRVLPFRPALLQAAVDSARPVQPVAIAYFAAGAPTDAAAFVGDMTLCQSLAAVLQAEALSVHLVVTAPLASYGRSRKALAREARAVVATCLDSLRGAEPASQARAFDEVTAHTTPQPILSSALTYCSPIRRNRAAHEDRARR